MPPIPCTVAQPFIRFEDDDDGFLPEGPRVVRLGERDALTWVNIQTAPNATRGAVHARFWDDGEECIWNQPKRPGFALPTDRPGVLFVGMEKELGTLDLESNQFRPLAKIPDISPRTIINDGEVVPGGQAIVFGTKDVRFADPIARLYLYALTDGSLTAIADRQTCSNGKVFGRDERGPVLFDIDTPTRTVARYRMEVGMKTMTPEGIALDTGAISGFPDGMCDGGDGTLIIAFYNPEPAECGRAVRFDLKTGQPVEEWTTPGSPRVTCPCPVQRPDGVKLVLTTAIEGMSADQRASCPAAGALFISDTQMKQCPKVELVRLS